jgi:hypothetical protein
MREFQTRMSMMCLDEYNTPLLEFSYLDAFITNLGGITYSYKDGQPVESTAQFSFSRMLINPLKKSTDLIK